MFVRSIVVVVCALACVAAASAQTSQAAPPYRGALRGAVRDPLGVIPGAEVTLIHESTRAEHSAMTNEAGEYTFKSVLPGTYTVCVSLPGFHTEERKNVRIGAQPSLVLDFTLELGTISQQLTVAGEGPLIELESATQPSSLDHAVDDASVGPGSHVTCSEVP